MNDDLKKLRLNLNERTSLLESVGWDEIKFTKLEEYLSNISQDFVVKHPKQVLKEVKNHFGEETAEVLKYIYLNYLKQFMDAENNK